MPELGSWGGEGLGNSGNARKKTFFFQLRSSLTQLKLFQNPLWFYMATGHKYLSRSVSILGARIGPEAKPLTGQSGRGTEGLENVLYMCYKMFANR